jgi:hypothetical protein
MMSNSIRWLTPAEAARISKISTKLLATWADKGLLTVVRGAIISGHRRYLEEEIDMLMIEAVCCNLERPTARIARDVAQANGYGAWRVDSLGRGIREARAREQSRATRGDE